MHYVIIGAGPAGVVAAETLRKFDPVGAITLVGGEAEPPYSRMAIPYYLAGKVPPEGTHLRKDPDHYDRRRIVLHHGAVAAVHPADHTVVFADGTEMVYDKLLIASGARPIRPPIPGLDLPGVQTCWTLDDARHIDALAGKGAHVVLMGAGFIGSIVLEALAERGVDLTVVEMGDRMVPRMMNDTAGGMIKRWCEAKGVRVLTSRRIRAITPGLAVVLDDGLSLAAEAVVISAGVRPNVEFLAGSGVTIDRGVVVDAWMQTSVPDIYAAGDVAQGKDLSSGGSEVHAIQPTATEHGRIAAMNMAGVATPYHGSLQMNVLDTLGLISASFGLWMGVPDGQGAEVIDSGDWRYLRLEFSGDHVVGATSIGLIQHIGALRGLIQSSRPLGVWKERLMRDPTRFAEAYVAGLA